ncbi:MAG: cysteine hydrolase family protein [Chloroflexota bacterium]
MTIWIDYASRITDKFDAARCALLIVDVQVSFCSPTGATARKHANTQMQALPAKINAFVDGFRRRGGLPIYIKSVPDNENASPTDLWLNRLKGVTRPATSNDPELNLYGLDIPDDAIIIEKKSDGFAHSNLKEVLDAQQIQTLLVCGVRTEICVRRTAERGAAEGYLIFVLCDLCATRDANQDHAVQALMFLNAYAGVVVDSHQMNEFFMGTEC